MTAFKQMIAICGFSIREAAEFLNVSENSVQSYCSGRRNPPDGIIAELADLYDRMDEAVETAIDLVDENQPDKVVFFSSGVHGKWPCQGTVDTIEAMIRLRMAVR